MRRPCKENTDNESIDLSERIISQQVGQSLSRFGASRKYKKLKALAILRAAVRGFSIGPQPYLISAFFAQRIPNFDSTMLSGDSLDRIATNTLTAAITSISALHAYTSSINLSSIKPGRNSTNLEAVSQTYSTLKEFMQSDSYLEAQKQMHTAVSRSYMHMKSKPGMIKNAAKLRKILAPLHVFSTGIFPAGTIADLMVLNVGNDWLRQTYGFLFPAVGFGLINVLQLRNIEQIADEIPSFDSSDCLRPDELAPIKWSEYKYWKILLAWLLQFHGDLANCLSWGRFIQEGILHEDSGWEQFVPLLLYSSVMGGFVSMEAALREFLIQTRYILDTRYLRTLSDKHDIDLLPAHEILASQSNNIVHWWQSKKLTNWHSYWNCIMEILLGILFAKSAHGLYESYTEQESSISLIAIIFTVCALLNLGNHYYESHREEDKRLFETKIASLVWEYNKAQLAHEIEAAATAPTVVSNLAQPLLDKS